MNRFDVFLVLSALFAGVSVVLSLWAFRLRKKVAMLTKEVQRKEHELSSRTTEFSRLVRVDPLTGIHNRKHFMELARIEFDRSRRYGYSFTIVVVDLDHFKAINDRYGYDIGDQALKHFCRVFIDNLRDVDLFARVGGEEFIVLMPDTPKDGGMLAAERLRRQISQLDMPEDTRFLELKASFGVAVYDELDKNVEAVLRRADKALSMAKKNGRNRVEICEEE